MRQWLDWPAPTVTSERAPDRSASAQRNSSLRALFPPPPRPVRSSRLTHRRAPPGSPGPRSSGVGSVASVERATPSIHARTVAIAPSSAAADIHPMVGMGAVSDQARTDWNPILRGEFAKPYWPAAAGLRHRRAPAPHRVPAPRRGVRRAPPHALRRDEGGDPRPGPVPRPPPGPRAVLLRAPRRGHPAVAGQHPQGAAERRRCHAAGPRQPRGLGGAGRAPPQHDADGARRPGRVAPGSRLGAVHRRGDPAGVGQGPSRSCSSSGAAMPARRRR